MSHEGDGHNQEPQQDGENPEGLRELAATEQQLDGAANTAQQILNGSQNDSVVVEDPTAGLVAAGINEQLKDIKPALDVVSENPIITPAVIMLDKDGSIVNAHLMLHQGAQNIVTIGASSRDNITLPRGAGFEGKCAQIRIENGLIYAKDHPEVHVYLQGNPHNFSISNQEIILNSGDILVIRSKNNEIHFKVEDRASKPSEVLAQLSRDIDDLEQEYRETLKGPHANDQNVLAKLEEKVKAYAETVERYRNQIPSVGIGQTLVPMLAHFAKLEADKKEKARIEYEAKMAPRRHFDESAGETAENRRPFSLMVLVDQKNRDAKGQRQMYVIFPPGITMGKSKLNTLELNGPKSADSANINVQDQECMLRYEDSKHARLIIDRRTLRNTRIVVNHELAGIRKGKTEELDMQRPVLKDDDHLQVGYNHYRLEMGHEFTYAAIRPHALKYLREIMEVLVLYSAEGDQGDIKNAEETLTYFVQKGILTEEEVAEERAIHERIKYINETSQAIDPNMKKITREDKASLDYVLGLNAALPYDAGDIVQAMAVAGMQFLHWHQTEWSQESYRLRLTESIQARVSAYEKKLAEIQAEMRKPKFAKRLSSVISKNAQKDYESEQENLRTTFRRIIVELVTLLKYTLPGIGNRVGWLSGRLDAKEYQQAEEIMEVQEVFDSLSEEKAPNNQQILKLRKIGETRKYSEFCAGGAGISDEPMGKVLDKKVKATATKFLSNARGGKHVSIYLDLLQEMIIDQIITFEDLGSSFEEFTEMRDAERYFNKVKEGEKMLKEIMAAGEENLEAVLDLAKKIDNDEVALGDEQQQQFRAYYLAGFANIFRDARQGAQAEYAATLARAAIRMGLATTEDFGITQEELENFSVTGERPEEDENFADQATEELSEQEKEISELINAVKRSEAHNIEPLINLLQYVHGHEDCTFQEEKITGILERMTIEKLHQIATSQEDMELGEMIVADMRDMGLEAIIEKEMERMVDQIIDWLVQGTKGTEAIKEIVETFSRLNLYDLMTSKVEGLKQQHLKQLLGDEEAVEKLIEDLKIVGLN